MNRARRQLVFAGAGLAALGSSRAQAEWPARPIRIVVPYATGGGADAVARVLAKPLTSLLGQAIVIDNRAGANGNIGLAVVAKSAPDGYTLLMATGATQSINPALYARLPFDVARDFTPIGLVATGPHVLVVSPSKFPVTSYNEFLAKAKAASALSYASSGAGSTAHLTAELWKDQVHLGGTHIPYRGTGPALTDVLGGQVDFMFCPIAAAVPFVQGSKLRGLLVTSETRMPRLPEVPTSREVGLPELLSELWYALYAPAKLPGDIQRKLVQATAKSLEDAEVRQALATQALVPLVPDPRNLASQQEADLARWTRIIKATGVTAE
jgi:tripartite-type tricarboxylate transporter receptor subunit TctC